MHHVFDEVLFELAGACFGAGLAVNIVFMTVSTLGQADRLKKLDLPESSQSDVPDAENLPNRGTQKKSRRKRRRAHRHHLARRTAPCAQIVKVMDACSLAGIEAVNFALGDDL